MKFSNLTPVPFHKVKVDSLFWSPRIDTIRRETTRYCLKRCEETGRIANFRRAAGMEPGEFQGIYFNDSDVYKVLEGVAYALMGGADPELEQAADRVIDAICASQQPDGYLFSYYTLTDPQKRWSDMGYHEAYCLGHMIEGAIAYFQATGKRKWLDCAERAVKQMMSVIGPGKRHWITGHQEIELALVKLYRLTGEQAYLDYAKWLIAERGYGHLHSLDFDRMGFKPEYCQDDLPAEQLSKVTGHAVRAMYYYTALADVAAIAGDEALAAALDRLWNNVVPANLYITGGIGQDSANEGFTRDWHLPNLTAYCETCAAIGMAFWNQRMNLLRADAKYADLVESELYNGALAGLSLDGKRFFYDNPLSSVGKYRRQEWFGCSCCPTNLVRFVPSVGGYMYSLGQDCVYVNQYIASTAEFELNANPVKLEMKTDYPWDGQIEIRNLGDELVKLKLRIPGWCLRFKLSVAGRIATQPPVQGYMEAALAPGEVLSLTLDTPPRRVYADARVKENAGRVAFARGPIVYCAEQLDQSQDIPAEYFHAEFAVSKETELTAQPYSADALGGIVKLQVGDAVLVPYYSWCNRGAGGMAVWIKEK